MTVINSCTSIRPHMLPASRRCSQQLLSDLQRARRGLDWRCICSAARASKFAPVADLWFEPLERGALIFPEILQPGAQAVVVGVDPDISGAIAVLSWQNAPAVDGGRCHHHPNHEHNRPQFDVHGDSSSSSNRSLTLCTHAPSLGSLTVAVHDLPVDVWQLGSRNKRQPSPTGIHHILQQYIQVPQLLGDEAPQGEGLAVARAVVEHTTPQHLSGKFAWYGMGYSFGLLTGLLTARGIPHRRVEASVWKRHMGLWRLGKDGSLALARQLFPQAEHLLRRKKDHGRAEALLIAAWGLGVRMQFMDPLMGSTRSSERDPPVLYVGGGEGRSTALCDVGGQVRGGRKGQTARLRPKMGVAHLWTQ